MTLKIYDAQSGEGTKHAIITCDFCGRTTAGYAFLAYGHKPAYSTIEKLWQRIEAQGWQDKTKDCCPECYTNPTSPAAAPGGGE